MTRHLKSFLLSLFPLSLPLSKADSVMYLLPQGFWFAFRGSNACSLDAELEHVAKAALDKNVISFVTGVDHETMV